MSKTKKILSLVLAVVLLMNVFAVSSFATVADGAILAVSASTEDKLVAGGQVTVDFSFELPAGVDYSTYKLGQFSATVFYDASILTAVSRTWNESSNYDFLNPDSKINTDSAKVLAKFPTPDYLSAEEAALYTGACLVPTGTYRSDNTQGATTATGWSMESQKDVIFSITFDVADDYDGSSEAAVAMLASCHPQGSQMYIKTVTDKANYTQGKISVDDMDYSAAAVKVTAPVAASKVYEVAKQVRANGDNIDLGVKAGFDTKDIAIAFDNATGTSTNVKTVGAKLKVNGEDAGTGTSRFVYKITDTEYQYRVIIENVAKDSTDVYTVELFVEMMDGTIITGDTVEIKAADVVGKLPA